MKKRSVTIKKHRTSVTLEDEFWTVLEKISKERSTSLQKTIEEIDEKRGERNLSSALRVFILSHLNDQTNL